MGKVTIQYCPLCESSKIKKSLACTDHYCSGESYDLFSCQDCKFTFTQNVPSESEIGAYYQTPDYISHTDTRKGVANTLYHWVRSYMLRRKAALIERTSSLKNGRLLDIGAGTGYFANEMERRGWKVEAVEKSEAARQFAADHFGLVLKEETAVATMQPGSLDVITLWHVMEHIQDLDGAWQKYYDLLGERGILILALPNRASYDADKYEEEWAAYDVPRHLWHFTPDTVQRFGAKHNFILAEKYAMPFDAFYISMLSEKFRGNRFSLIRGMATGTKAWFHTLGKREKSSSMIYIFRKKRDE